MPEVNSVVAVYDNRSQAEKALKELQRAGVDMTKISIVGNVKTGRVSVICDGPFKVLSNRRERSKGTRFPTAA
jgi:6-phosphogluconolactonase (cycloisomerase 2 family)